ncbi:MAG: phage scaffolding protein [Mogibacterium sp.]|nr:phage scaffolding protein [Mogibacterium sp.]
MKKEDFVALGISEELSEKAAKASDEELKSFIPKSRFDEVNTAKKNAETLYADTQKELEKLKESAGDNEELQRQIKQLQEALKTKDSSYSAKIAEMKMSNAIIAALGTSARDAGLVNSLLDKTKLVLTESGTVAGLDEQVKALKENKPFLFNDEKGYPDVKDGGEAGGKGGMSTREQFAEALNGAI